MPWTIERRDGRYCVVKTADGKSAGCHDSRADAIKQQRALYVKEKQMAADNVEEAAWEKVTNDTPWEGPLGLEGFATSDRRYLIPGEILERDLPLPLNVQMMTAEGHANSVNAGRIERIEHIRVDEFDRREEFGLEDVPDEAIVIFGHGVFDGSDAASEGQRMLQNGAGISLDLPPDRFALINPETLEEMAEEDVTLDDVLAGVYLTGIGGKIAGATVVTIPAFEHASIRVQEGKVLVASAFKFKMGMEADPFMRDLVQHLGEPLTQEQIDAGASATLRLALTPASSLALTAAASWKPPRSWFDDPALSRVTPMTISPEGRVYGHLADWDGCHIGFSGTCMSPYDSPSDFAYFHTGLLETDDGEIPVGKWMFSRTGGKHAPLDRHVGVEEAARHYDDSTKVGAFVRAGRDRHGIWLAGALKPGITDDDIAHLKSHLPSGDWRPIRGASELVAAFSVPIGGFPIPQVEALLVASGGVGEVGAFITGPVEVKSGNGVSKSHRRKLKMLSDRAHSRS